MGLSGIEQMAHLARQADVAMEKAQEKSIKRGQKHKVQDLERQERVEKSQSVPTMNENQRIDALNHDDNHRDRHASHQKSQEEEKKLKKSHYYNDPSLGGNIDISS